MNSELVSMEVDNDDMGCTIGDSSYGYGTCLCLNAQQVKALGITGTIDAGTPIMIQARAYVRSAQESVEEEEDDKDVTLSLQITDMAITSGATPKESPADKLYGNNTSA